MQSLFRYDVELQDAMTACPLNDLSNANTDKKIAILTLEANHQH
jgi:hypothetical protein